MERKTVNNAFYDELGEQWYESFDHPIALLRAENRARAPWVADAIASHFPQRGCTIADLGCGAGFLSNQLAIMGHHVTGVDLSEKSLEIAKTKDTTQSVAYIHANACSLPLKTEQFDVVCAMDLLEHVENPTQVIAEASRLLKPNGLFFFHTFNRTWTSWLCAIKGLSWFIPNSPPNIHLYRYFIKPAELSDYLASEQLTLSQMVGFMPSIDKNFFKLIFQRTLTPDFSFKVVPSLRCGYMGYATK